MKLSRIDGLSDGIFAIVMTLLIIEIRVPEFHEKISNHQLWHALKELSPLFLSYILSFALLFTYWRAHYFVLAIAKNFNVRLTNYNALFLFFIGLLPFFTHLLGRYTYSELSIFLYGLNIVLIGVSLSAMRRYIVKSDHIESVDLSSKSIRHANIRLWIPVAVAVVAVAISFISPLLSVSLFTLLIIFNLTPVGADLIDALIRKLMREK